MTLQELEARVRRLEDIEEIKQLMFNYTYWLDYGELEKALDCFADDAKMDIGMRGGPQEDGTNFELTCEGKDSIRDFYSIVLHQKDRFSASHLILNPVVTVEGDRAEGIFYLLEPTSIARAMWGHGRYDMEFKRIGGKWKISFFGFLWNFNTPYDEGWSKTPMAIL